MKHVEYWKAKKCYDFHHLLIDGCIIIIHEVMSRAILLNETVIHSDDLILKVF